MNIKPSAAIRKNYKVIRLISTVSSVTKAGKKREKKETKKGTNSESGCVIIVASKGGLAKSLLFLLPQFGKEY